jgi:hypothetical protein
MRLADVNVLVYAFRDAAPRHAEYRGWLERLVASSEPFAVADSVLAGFLRVVTHPRVFHPPAPVGDALAFANALRSQPNAVVVSPGPGHWEIFARLCLEVEARGNLIPDAWLAALAIEQGCEFVTTDRDFARFSELRWSHPLA